MEKVKVTLQNVEHVAWLARLEIPEDEKELFTHHLNQILTYMEKLNELNTEEVEPTAHILPLKNVFRRDQVVPSLPQKDVLEMAPEAERGHVKVPRIIE